MSMSVHYFDEGVDHLGLFLSLNVEQNRHEVLTDFFILYFCGGWVGGSGPRKATNLSKLSISHSPMEKACIIHK